jgi:hypothetical protein
LSSSNRRKVAVQLRAAAHDHLRRIEPRLIRVRHRDDLRAGQRNKTARMNAPDQPAANHADADALIRAEHALRRER